MPVKMVVRSESWVLAGWLLESWVRIPFKAWMFVLVFLHCPVLWALRWADDSSKESCQMSELLKKPPICEAAKVQKNCKATE
jgi:hypothetical protein